MALPTAATPGYGYYPTVGVHPDVACNCLRTWLPLFRRLCELKGLGRPDVWQCTGGDYRSAGTHTQGGVFDIGGTNLARVRLARDMGALATWPRYWTGNYHTHGILNGCAHNGPARYQLSAWHLGYDGTGYLGRGGKDTYYRPLIQRTWSQGIEWARAEIARLTGATTTPTAPKPPAIPKEWDEMATQAELEASFRKVLAERNTADVLFAGHNIIKDMRAANPDTAPRVTPSTALERSTWGMYVKRGDGSNALQELADAHTKIANLTTIVAGMAAALARIEAALKAQS